MNKIEQRQKRLTLINQLGALEKNNCRKCPKNYKPLGACQGCPIFNDIRNIGYELDKLSKRKNMVIPAELTLSSYRFLRELEWMKSEISEYYGLTKNEFSFFLRSHKECGILKEDVIQYQDAEIKKIDITLDQYNKLRKEGITDKAIRERFGYSTGALVHWKRKNGIQIKQKAVKVKS